MLLIKGKKIKFIVFTPLFTGGERERMEESGGTQETYFLCTCMQIFSPQITDGKSDKWGEQRRQRRCSISLFLKLTFGEVRVLFSVARGEEWRVAGRGRKEWNLFEY